MNRPVNKTVPVNGADSAARHSGIRLLINLLANVLTKLGQLRQEADYHLLRWSMVIIFFFFAYQKRFAYEVDRLIPFISNGPLIFWLYPLFGMRGATLLLGVSEWTLVRCCSSGSGTRHWALLGRWAQPLPS